MFLISIIFHLSYVSHVCSWSRSYLISPYFKVLMCVTPSKTYKCNLHMCLLNKYDLWSFLTKSKVTIFCTFVGQLHILYNWPLIQKHDLPYFLTPPPKKNKTKQSDYSRPAGMKLRILVKITRIYTGVESEDSTVAFSMWEKTAMVFKGWFNNKLVSVHHGICPAFHFVLTFIVSGRHVSISCTVLANMYRLLLVLTH